MYQQTIDGIGKEVSLIILSLGMDRDTRGVVDKYYSAALVEQAHASDKRRIDHNASHRYRPSIFSHTAASTLLRDYNLYPQLRDPRAAGKR